MRRALLVAALVACRTPPPAPLAIAHDVLPIDARPFTAVSIGDATYLFEHERTVIVRGERVVATAAAPPRRWIAAVAIPALDGDGRWVVATDGAGTLYRIRLDGEREAIGDRFGLTAPVGELASAGRTFALVAGSSIAYTQDGVHLERVALDHQPMHLAAASGRLAFALRHRVEVWNLADHTRTSYAVDGVPYFAGAQLVVATSDALFVASGDRLERVALPAVTNVALAAARVWVIASYAKLYVLDGARAVATDQHEVRGTLLGMPDGSAWLARGTRTKSEAMMRFSLAPPRDDRGWAAQVKPVFDRVCAHCHLPGGSADADLSTAAAWQTERDEIARRVLATRTMPPAGTAMSDVDREALAAWLHAR